MCAPLCGSIYLISTFAKTRISFCVVIATGVVLPDPASSGAPRSSLRSHSPAPAACRTALPAVRSSAFPALNPLRHPNVNYLGAKVYSAVGRAILPAAAFRRLFCAMRESSEPQSPAESRRQPGLAAPQSGIAANTVLGTEPGGRKILSQGAQPWVQVAN